MGTSWPGTKPALNRAVWAGIPGPRPSLSIRKMVLVQNVLPVFFPFLPREALGEEVELKAVEEKKEEQRKSHQQIEDGRQVRQ